MIAAATASVRRACARPTKPRSRCSGWRARRWRGTASPAAWAQQGLDLWQNARLFGLLNVALADGYVASWATKYHYRSGARRGRSAKPPTTETRDARGGLDVAAAHAAGPRLRVGMRWRAPRPPRS
jgi:hypothetical protein